MSQSTAVATREAPQPTGVSALLEHARHRIEPFLPAGVSLERTMTAVYLATKDNPSILDCAPESIVRAVGRILQWGLEPGVTAHLVPFGKTCTPVADYKGLVELMVASGAVRSVEARCVYSGEEFQCEQGLEPVLRHIPRPGAQDRGALVGAYCILRLPFNRSSFEYMPIEDIDAIREKHSKQWKKGPCPPWYAMKTVVRQSTKLVPKNPRLAKMLAVVAEDEAGEFEPVTETPRLTAGARSGDEEYSYRTIGPVSPAGYEADEETGAAPRFGAGYEPPTRAGNTTAQLTPAAIAEAAQADPYDVAHQVTGEIDPSAWAEVDEDTTPMSKRLTVNDLARKARERKAQRDWLHTQVITKGALTLSQAQYVQKTLLDESLKEADLSELVAQIKAAQANAAAAASGEVVCPKCSGPMWDNRETKKNPRQPDYKCKDRDGCDGVIWPPRERTPKPDAIAADGEPEFLDFTGDDI